MNTLEKKLYESFMMAIAANYLENPTLSAKTIFRVVEMIRHELTEDWIKNHPTKISQLRGMYEN